MNFGYIIVVVGAALSALISLQPAKGAGSTTDKTLVAWARADDAAVGGGSVLTIGEGDNFDALVFGEKHPRQWMAGSENYHRTNSDPIADEPLHQAEFAQIAFVQQGRQATLFRNGKQMSTWQLDADPPVYGKAAYVSFGWRHMGALGPAYFKGAIAEARIYKRALTAEELINLQPHRIEGEMPFGWWDFQQDAHDKAGNFPGVQLIRGAKIADGALQLSGNEDYLLCSGGAAAIDRVRFRPAYGTFADPIPFYWKGAYHVFYLHGYGGKVPWQHIVSTDLVHWKQLPTAIVTDGSADSWDGGYMFTGSVTEKDGKFYLFYTGWNMSNPQGREGIRLATSDDLITWHKQPDFLLVGDGLVYSRTHDSNFRDAFVYRDAERSCWKMLLCADNAAGKGVAGAFVSQDLLQWHPDPPIGEFQECPDFFQIGDTSYLLGGGFFSSKVGAASKFTRPIQSVIDSPAVYAGKTMFDGRRHVWVGWLADRAKNKDNGEIVWGGYMCTPRELMHGPGGQLYVRPVEEAVHAYSQTARTFGDFTPNFTSDQWAKNGSKFVNKATPAEASFEVSDDGLVETACTLSPDAVVTLSFHQQGDDEKAYAFILDRAASTVTTHGQGVTWKREGCAMEASMPLRISAILGSGTVEVFIDDKYAFSRRTHELTGGKMSLSVERGTLSVEDLSVKQQPSAN